MIRGRSTGEGGRSPLHSTKAYIPRNAGVRFHRETACLTGKGGKVLTRQPVVYTQELEMILGNSRVLENISMEVFPGDMVGIIGPNGAGKTTLLRLLLGLIRPTAGTVLVFGTRPEKLGKTMDEVGYMPQHPTFTDHFPLSAEDVVLMGTYTASTMGRRLPAEARQRAALSLERVGLLDRRGTPFHELSGGQRQRAFLARALCKEPRLLLLDEPNAGLDLPTQSRFFALLQELRLEKGITVLLVSHDLAVVARYASRLICINRTMHVHGSPADVLNSPQLEEAYRCEFDVLLNMKRG